MALATEGRVLVSRGDFRPCPTRAMPRPAVTIRYHAFIHPLGLGQAGPGWLPLESQQLPWCGPGFCWQFSSVVLYAPAVGIKSIKTSKFLILLDLLTQKHLLKPPLLPLHKEYQAFSILFYFKHAVLGPGGWHVRVSQQDSLQTRSHAWVSHCPSRTDLAKRPDTGGAHR